MDSLVVHITKTRLFKYSENFTTTKWKLSDEKFWWFSYICLNIDCGYLLEPPQRGGSNEYPQSMFLSRNKKINVYPCKPQFYCIKVGFKGSKLCRRVFVMKGKMSIYHCRETKSMVANHLCLRHIIGSVVGWDLCSENRYFHFALYCIPIENFDTQRSWWRINFSFFSYFHYLRAYHGYREHLRQNPEKLTGSEHGQLRSYNKNLFYCNPTGN